MVLNKQTKGKIMVTCVIHYRVDADKLAEFEHYAKLWISLVNKFGGQHQGYFLPSEGDNDLGNLRLSHLFSVFSEKVSSKALL